MTSSSCSRLTVRLLGALALCCPAAALADGFPGLSKADREAIGKQIEAAYKKCPCLAEQSFVTVERVIPRIGNNPFDPANPLGPQTATGVIPAQPKTCTAPPPPSESQTLPCPAGQSGGIVQSRSYACSDGNWLPGAWTVTSNTCSTPAQTCTGSPPPSESQTISCPPGQTGAIIQTRSYACSGTAWTAGPWSTTSNSCVTPPPVCTGSPPPSESQIIACPAGQVGSVIQNRTYSCVNGAWTAGAWSTTSSSCSTPPSGCATNYSSGTFACSGSRGISSTTLNVTPGSALMTATSFGANSNVAINCSGATGTPQSTNLIILGLPGHTCSFSGTGMTSFGIACRNNSGGSCTSSCTR